MPRLRPCYLDVELEEQEERARKEEKRAAQQLQKPSEPPEDGTEDKKKIMIKINVKEAMERAGSTPPPEATPPSETQAPPGEDSRKSSDETEVDCPAHTQTLDVRLRGGMVDKTKKRGVGSESTILKDHNRFAPLLELPDDGDRARAGPSTHAAEGRSGSSADSSSSPLDSAAREEEEESKVAALVKRPSAAERGAEVHPPGLDSSAVSQPQQEDTGETSGHDSTATTSVADPSPDSRITAAGHSPGVARRLVSSCAMQLIRLIKSALGTTWDLALWPYHVVMARLQGRRRGQGATAPRSNGGRVSPNRTQARSSNGGSDGMRAPSRAWVRRHRRTDAVGELPVVSDQQADDQRRHQLDALDTQSPRPLSIVPEEEEQ